MDDAARSICDRVLKYAPHFKNLTHLILRQSDITDDGLQVVTQLPMLQEIDLFTTDIHGQCLTNFHRLHDLENLNLSFNGLESPYLHFLTELPALRALNLRKTGINRDGIRQIARCKNLKTLTLSANRHVDDECVFGLALLTKLQSLDLDGTTVTKVGLMKLASLDLRNMSLPVTIQSKSDLAELHRAFPHCYLNVSKATRVTTKDEKEFFAPLK
jgi:hypothetical protein